MFHLESWTFVFVIINLLLLYIVLKKLLFGKVTEFMDNRKNSIQASIENAENLNTEAQKLKNEYEAHLANSRTEAAKIVDDAKIRANKEYEKILTQAKVDAQRLMDSAKIEIQNEKTKLLSQVKDYVADLTIKAASKLITENLDNEKNLKLVNKFIEEDGAA